MKINFIIADEIRPEITGKVTVLGLYPDSIVIANTPKAGDDTESQAPRLIDRLAILINISDIPDNNHEYDYKGQFICPDENHSENKIDFGKRVSEKGKSHTIVLELKPFIIHGIGTYIFKLFIDNEVYSFPFSILDSNAL